MASLENRLKTQASAIGFELAGIARATAADTFDQFVDWLERDFAGEMKYMSRHADARRHPASILPEVRSVVMLGMNYLAPEGQSRPDLAGRVARYARGADYHDVL